MRQIQFIQTPIGPIALVRQTAEKLLTEGVISGTLDGDLHAADAATVKAAIMMSAICDFCSSPGASHFYDVPDFGVTKNDNPNNYGAAKSTGGWMGCDDCAEIIASVEAAENIAHREARKRRLVDRAVDNMAFPKFSRRAIEELYIKFWEGMKERDTALGAAKGVADFVEDKLPQGLKPIFTERDKRVQAMVRITGLTLEEVEAAVRGELNRDVVGKLAKWRDKFGTSLDPQKLADLLAGVGPKKPLADIVPHWQRALDAKFTATTRLTKLLSNDARSEHFSEYTDLNDPKAVREVAQIAQARATLKDFGFDEDLKMLHAAQAYSFNGETIAAIREAARHIPHEAPLSSIETPNTGARWFWFSEPLPLTASPIISDKVHGLLWGWVDGYRRKESRFPAGTPQWIVNDVLAGKGEPAIAFSAYVIDENGTGGGPKGMIWPSTRWYWPLTLSFRDMIEFNTKLHRESYGPGSKYGSDKYTLGEEVTMNCISQLSLFFIMSCLWFKQTAPVLERTPGHVERHAKKRYVKEHKLKEPPTVQVVALRKSVRTPVAQAEGEQQEAAREYHCRWIVQGHPRLQPCGPGRKDKKLIWIETHIAGPDDKPLRTREKVFAVIR